MQSGSNERFTNQAGQQYVDSGSAGNSNSPTSGWQFSQPLDENYLGSAGGPSHAAQAHENFATTYQPRFLYNFQGNNNFPYYEGSPIGYVQQPTFDNMMDGNHIDFALQEPPISTSHLRSRPIYPTSFPESTCNLATIQTHHMEGFEIGFGASSSNALPAPSVPQPTTHAGTALEAKFNPNWPMEVSMLPAPGLDADFAGPHSGSGPATAFEPLWLAEQTWATPSWHAGVHEVAGTSAAYIPIGDHNTLAHVALPSDNPKSAKSWEMRDNKYFCLYQGCHSPFFKRIGDLERHQNNVHTQTKFFWCRSDECDRGRPFPRKDKRNEHERKIHGVDYTLAENY
ncbi:hypothetical protein GTA08_BOTSDO04678 [Neofusicoccum parvum]|uniref:Uncharacterized protein n=1 Tax=Neofusicoccum parvum TaxID=310453 RepID=A0ACB5RV83_9PEZI|nr:hypothetical protein GTA08_BOTSDO04678 [Neofusicoccum parvum]